MSFIIKYQFTKLEKILSAPAWTGNKRRIKTKLWGIPTLVVGWRKEPSEKTGEQRRQAGQHGAITLFADTKVARGPVRSPEKETPK